MGLNKFYTNCRVKECLGVDAKQDR